MKKRILFILTMFVVLGLSAQQRLNQMQKAKFFITPGLTVDNTAIGSPYIQEAFLPSAIDGFAGTYFLRFNAVSEEMEVQTGGKINIVPTANVASITFNNTNVSYYPIQLEGKTIFIKTLWLGENQEMLVLREQKKFVKAKAAKSNYDTAKPAKYTGVQKTFYLQLASGELITLESKKKKFFDAFKGKKKEVEAFVKKQKLQIDEEEDLKKIMTFYFNS
jgi:hypothetical protein